MVDVQIAASMAVLENNSVLEDEEEEQEAWLREIEEVAAQFVCLYLEDQLGAQPLGGGKSPARLLSHSGVGQVADTSSNAPEVKEWQLVCHYTSCVV